jgi:hypothetical protein
MGISSGSINKGRLNAKPRVVNPSRPFGMPKTPFNPETGAYLPLGPAAAPLAKTFTVVSEENDYLVCRDSNANIIAVAKPYTLRLSTFHGVTVGGVSYVYSDANKRVASADGEDDETQEITPSYFAGEQILAMSHNTGVLAGLSAIEWEDINTAGRAWAVVL